MGWVFSKDGYYITRNSVTAGDRRAVTELCCRCHVTHNLIIAVLLNPLHSRQMYQTPIVLTKKCARCTYISPFVAGKYEADCVRGEMLSVCHMLSKLFVLSVS